MASSEPSPTPWESRAPISTSPRRRGLGGAASELPRAVTLEGASNVRDLGGWPTEGGGRVAFGHVFRAAALSRLTDAHHVAVTQIGLRTVCDLRGKRESERAPSRLDGLAWIEL